MIVHKLIRFRVLLILYHVISGWRKMCLTCGGKPHFEGIFPNVFYERRGRDSAFPWEMMEKGSKWNAYIFILIATKVEEKKNWVNDATF